MEFTTTLTRDQMMKLNSDLSVDSTIYDSILKSLLFIFCL